MVVEEDYIISVNRFSSSSFHSYLYYLLRLYWYNHQSSTGTWRLYRWKINWTTNCFICQWYSITLSIWRRRFNRFWFKLNWIKSISRWTWFSISLFLGSKIFSISWFICRRNWLWWRSWSCLITKSIYSFLGTIFVAQLLV